MHQQWETRISMCIQNNGCHIEAHYVNKNLSNIRMFISPMY